MFFLSCHGQEQSSSDLAGKTVLDVCRWQQEEFNDDRDSHSQGSAQHCPGVWGQSRQAERASGVVCMPLPPDHSCCVSHLFFQWGRRRGKGYALLLVGRM